MKQRIKRELDFSIRLTRLSLENRAVIHHLQQRLRDDYRGLLLSLNLARTAQAHFAITGQRLYVQQIARGIYRHIADVSGEIEPFNCAS